MKRRQHPRRLEDGFVRRLAEGVDAVQGDDEVEGFV